jgi:nucleotide-binding universal stress UspA family protein
MSGGLILVGVDDSPRSDEASAFAAYLGDALGWATRNIRATGSPANEIHAAAVRDGARLIVVGRSHVGPGGRIVPGSTAERIAQHAPCPVVVVPPDWRRTFETIPRTVAVAVDGSPEAEAAVEAAVAVSRAWSARLRVVTVCAYVPYPYGVTAAGAYLKQESAERDAQDRLDRLVARIDEDLAPQGMLLRGDAEHELAGHSAGLALLVVGSRGYGPARAVAVGGVSGRLIRDAACPVMVVPRLSRAAGAGD